MSRQMLKPTKMVAKGNNDAPMAETWKATKVYKEMRSHLQHLYNYTKSGRSPTGSYGSIKQCGSLRKTDTNYKGRITENKEKRMRQAKSRRKPRKRQGLPDKGSIARDPAQATHTHTQDTHKTHTHTRTHARTHTHTHTHTLTHARKRSGQY